MDNTIPLQADLAVESDEAFPARMAVGSWINIFSQPNEYPYQVTLALSFLSAEGVRWYFIGCFEARHPQSISEGPTTKI
jgi:hypothetical protein